MDVSPIIKIVGSLLTAGRDGPRAIPHDNVPSGLLALSSVRQRHPADVELAAASRQEAARQALLATAVATPYHRLLGKKGRTRRRCGTLTRRLAQTVFVAFLALPPGT